MPRWLPCFSYADNKSRRYPVGQLQGLAQPIGKPFHAPSYRSDIFLMLDLALIVRQVKILSSHRLTFQHCGLPAASMQAMCVSYILTMYTPHHPERKSLAAALSTCITIHNCEMTSTRSIGLQGSRIEFQIGHRDPIMTTDHFRYQVPSIHTLFTDVHVPNKGEIDNSIASSLIIQWGCGSER